MISIESLRDEREDNYKVWFERWWKKADLERQIVNANARGFTFIKIDLLGLDEHTKRRMTDEFFMRYLRRRLPGFTVKTEYTQGVLFNYTKASYILISWDEEEEEDE